MYLEDTDLCWRLRNAKWEVAYEPGGVVVHVQGASASRRPYRMLLEHHRSAWRFAAFASPARAVLPAFAAVYFVDAAVMAMSRDTAWRSSRASAGLRLRPAARARGHDPMKGPKP